MYVYTPLRLVHDNCCISVVDLNENATLYICGTISFLCVPNLSRQLLHFCCWLERKCCTLHMWDNFVRWFLVFGQDNCCIFVWYMNENAASSQWQVLHFVDHFDKNAAVDISVTFSFTFVTVTSWPVLHFCRSIERKSCSWRNRDNFVHMRHYLSLQVLHFRCAVRRNFP